MQVNEMPEGIHEPASEDEVNLLDVIIVLFKYKRLIWAVTLGIGILALVICLVVTPVYQGVSQVLPPQDSSVSSAVLAQLGAAGGAITALTGISPTSPSLMYVGFLKSRTVFDAIIDKFDLIRIYKLERFLGRWRKYTRDDARDDLTSLAVIETDESGIITTSVQDNDPQKSADMANAFVDELRKLVLDMTVTDAGQRRAFFQQQFNQTLKALTTAEEDLKQFEEKTGALQIDEQARAVMAGIAALEAQIAASEIAIKVMKTYATQQNPDVKMAQQQLKAMKEERKRLEAEGAPLFSDSKTLIPTGQVPQVATEYLRKVRELKYQQVLYDVLLKQYEAARLEEAKDSVTLKVVSTAVAPEKVYKPKWVLVTVIMTGIAFFLGIFAAFVVEAVHRLSGSPAQRDRMKDLRNYLAFK
jgi:tyrosine-protein kinase Etk/Wzc